MKFFILVFSFVLYLFTGYAQDTVYLNINQQINATENASSLKVSTKSNNLYTQELFYSSGKRKSLLNYSDESLKTLEGYAKYFYENGNLDSEGNYRNNKRNGYWKFYNISGKPTGGVFFKDGKLATGEYAEQFSQMVHGSTNILPFFKGGTSALIEYFRKNCKYPDQQSKAGKEKEKDKKENVAAVKAYRPKGVVKVGFTVSEKGKVTNVHLISGVSDDLNKEALRLISEMPDWYPGLHYDVPVKVPFILPIVF